MARVRFLRDVNARYVPQLAPWRGTEVPICSVPGRALPAGAPFEIDDAIAYTAWRDFARLFGSDVEWLSLPGNDVLAAQRAVAVSYHPHMEDHISVPLPGETDA